jgi:hypothetical protein
MSIQFHKIETLFERDENTHKVIPGKLKNQVYGIFKTWQFTEKIDGNNIRVTWEPEIKIGTDELNRAVGKPECLRFGGKTDEAQLHAGLVEWLQQNVTVEKLRVAFPDVDVIIYGEGYGPGIQKGGGKYSKTKQFIVFDVLVGGKWWLNWENTCDVAAKLGLKTVPFVGEMTLEEGVEMVRKGFNSVLAAEQTGEITPAEGLVGRTVEALFDKKGHRIIIKLKTKDF